MAESIRIKNLATFQINWTKNTDFPNRSFHVYQILVGHSDFLCIIKKLPGISYVIVLCIKRVYIDYKFVLWYLALWFYSYKTLAPSSCNCPPTNLHIKHKLQSILNSNSHCRYCDWLQRQNQVLPNGTKINWKSLVISDFVIPDLQNGQNAPKMPTKCLYDFCFLKTCNT